MFEPSRRRCELLVGGNANELVTADGTAPGCCIGS